MPLFSKVDFEVITCKMENEMQEFDPFDLKNAEDSVFAESANFAAIYNIAPILPGHSLIIPKRHVLSVLELSDSELAELMIFSKRVVEFLLKAFKADAFNWTIQDGEPAGQTVPHMHLHLIPRKEDDLPSPGDWYPLLKKAQTEVIDSDERVRLTSSQMRRIVSHLRKLIREGDFADISRNNGQKTG